MVVKLIVVDAFEYLEVGDVDCENVINAVVEMFFLNGNSPPDVLVMPYRKSKTVIYPYNIHMKITLASDLSFTEIFFCWQFF